MFRYEQLECHYEFTISINHQFSVHFGNRPVCNHCRPKIEFLERINEFISKVTSIRLALQNRWHFICSMKWLFPSAFMCVLRQQKSANNLYYCYPFSAENETFDLVSLHETTLLTAVPKM